MKKTPSMALMAMLFVAQGALANTILLKDRQDQVCYNSASSNPGGVIGYGGINRDGTGFIMTISNPAGGTKTPATGDCANIPTTTTNLVFTGGNVVANVVPVTHVKPGTNGQNECLDQGLNLAGVTGGASIGSGANTLSIGFSFAGAAGCAHPNYTGATYQAPFQRTAIIATGSGPFQQTLFNGRYHIFDQATVPEPGTLPLLLAGASGLALLALRRRSRRSRQ
jgi:hypothetical protein